MNDPPTTAPPNAAERDYQRQLRDMNEALLVATVRQHELTEQAQKAEIRYRRLFESAQDGILILDLADGRIVDANPFMSELLGHSHANLQGKELWEIGLFSDQSKSETAVRELQEQGYVRYEHLAIETRPGRQAEVEVVANAYQEGYENVVQCTIRDITERSRLERQALDKTADLTDLHRRKDEFLAMLSHELRNPLAAISNAATLLRLDKGGENPLQRQGRTVIERQLAQLVRLVDDLLEISRITTGRVQLRQDLLAVGGVVERAIESVEPLVNQRQLALTPSLPPGPIWVFGDAARLEQVVVNLLNNAAKYTEPGGYIWLGLEQEGGEAVLRVRDSGVGIAPELLPRVFDLFTQAERTLDRSQGGLGIGLALVHRLVEMHGGRVEAHSSLGQGSEFVVRLPVMSPPEAAPPEDVPEADEPAGPSLRVLVIEDNVDAAYSLAMLLKATGHEVRMAHDGPSGWQAALDFRPDALLLDIGLPGFDGYEIARRVRARPELAGVTLIAVTGYSQGADRERSSEAGIDHHISKPANWETLRQILATVAEGRAAGSQLSS